MLRSFWLCLFWMMLVVGVPARADVLPFYSQLGTVTAHGASIADVNAINATGGAIYVNSQSTALGAGTMSLGVLPISNATLSQGGLGLPSFGTGNLGVVVIGIQGSHQAPGGVPTASFNTGVAQVYSVPLAGFSTANPSSWTNGTLLASYSLALAADTLQGNADAQAAIFSQAVMNTIAANMATSNQAQGRLLFNENGNQNFINLTTFDPGSMKDLVLPEQLLMDIGEALEVPSGVLPAGYQASVASLDALAMLLGLSKFSSYGAFDPYNTSGTYDYVAAFNGRLIPGGQIQAPPQTVAPEPASLLVWGTAFMAGLCAYRNRKRHAVS